MKTPLKSLNFEDSSMQVLQNSNTGPILAIEAPTLYIVHPMKKILFTLK